MTGKELKEWRTGEGMTQKQVADAIGMNRETVRRAEQSARVSKRLCGNIAELRRRMERDRIKRVLTDIRDSAAYAIKSMEG